VKTYNLRNLYIYKANFRGFQPKYTISILNIKKQSPASNVGKEGKTYITGQDSAHDRFTFSIVHIIISDFDEFVKGLQRLVKLFTN